ncbi:MAG: DUF3060 domain-containing protein [Acidobacteriota bacterium]
MSLNTHKKLGTIVQTLVLTLAMIILASCDLRSGTAKEEAEKFNGTPTPTVSPTPTPIPIDPADIIQVDTSQTGDEIAVNRDQPNKIVACTKYNDVNINGDSHSVTIKGACQQITINGDNNKIITDAAMRFVINGDENTIGYLKFPNGQRPSLIDHGDGNVIEKVSADALANNSSNSKLASNSSKNKGVK